MTTTPEPETSASGVPTWATLLLAGVWLVFLLGPLGHAADALPAPMAWLALASGVAFAAVYLYAILLHTRLRDRHVMDLPALPALVIVGLLLALTVPSLAVAGQSASGMFIYIAVVIGLAFPQWYAALGVVALSGLALGLTFVLPGWSPKPYNPAITLTAGFVTWGVKQILVRNADLVRIRAEVERLVVEEERNQFARDLHDILGHSLTVITVKAELSRRLMDIDLERARTELADLERLARESLGDVRQTVQGYREITLPGEIARARLALTAAGIEHELPTSTDDVPAELRELFAWAIREGVTNVIRHSGADSCTVRLAGDRVSVADDGLAVPGPIGNGLSGLRERAHAVGAIVRTLSSDARGFTLEVIAA